MVERLLLAMADLKRGDIMIFNSWNVQSTPAVRIESLVDRLIQMRLDIEDLHRKNVEALDSSGCYSLMTRKEIS